MRLLIRRRWIRWSLTGIVVLVLAGSVTAWVAARTWLPGHVLETTGRPEIPEGLCSHCHRSVSGSAQAGSLEGPSYVSPAGLAVSPDGVSLFVTASGADQLLEVDLSSGTVVRVVEIPGGPHGVDVSADGARLAVSRRHDDRVTILDAGTLQEQGGFDVTEPLGLALSAAGDHVFVADGFNNALVVAGSPSALFPVRVVAGNQPYAVDLSADESLVAVANRLVHPVPPGVLASSEITLVDARQRRVVGRRRLESAHLSEGVVISRDGSFALAGIVRFRNLLPLTQVARGAVMNSALAYVETRPGGRVVQFPLDEVNAYFADPSGVALTPDDRVAFVAHAGANVVTAVDVQVLSDLVAASSEMELAALADDLGASAQYVVARIPTMALPKALALSPSGDRLYVAEQLADSVAVIDTHSFKVIERIGLGGPEELTAERRGALVFHDASVTFQSQFSCRSCHPDGHSDALIWDFEIDGVGQNLVDTRSLLGIRETAPFKWNGKNPDLKTQCGPRFARVLMRSDPFPRDQLSDLVAYIESLPVSPARIPDELAEARERGRRVFFRTRTGNGEEMPKIRRCATCHRPPLFTDRLSADVGTGGRFDTPHLFGVGTTAPYLHDGRALTLEEIWTVHSPHDEHGAANDLTKIELNDLVIYLRSL